MLRGSLHRLLYNDLVIVCRGRHVAAVAGPVGVHEGSRLGDQLVRVRTEVVSLSLEQHTIHI